MTELSVLVSGLPADPSKVPTVRLAAACREVYTCREQIVGNIDVESGLEALRRTNAIEKYVKDKQHKAEAERAARILETAVGVALGPPAPPKDRGQGRNGKSVDRDQLISKDVASRFRLMAERRRDWWPELEAKPLSRRNVLTIIDEARRPKANGSGVAMIEQADAIEWLGKVSDADLLLTDPPYSTDVAGDIGAFVESWLPLALSKMKPSGRALVFIGAYADELAAYFSLPLPAGWTWGTPHAWVYRNTIGPTPKQDFIRNWQCVLSARGPAADDLYTDRITELLSGFIENAPDGRHAVKHHKWEKPLPVVQRLIRVSTAPGDIVIDPFAGSGTTLLAAKYEGRHGIGCDQDASAVKTAKKRGCDAS